MGESLRNSQVSPKGTQWVYELNDLEVVGLIRKSFLLLLNFERVRISIESMS